MAGLKRPIGNPDGTNGGVGSSAAFEVLLKHSRSNWDPVDYLRDQEAVAVGAFPIISRSTGSRKQGIQRGDRIFLFLTGHKNRGLMASGHAEGEIYMDDHWDKAINRKVPYVDVKWNALLDSADALPWREIALQIPGFPKHFQSAGQIIQPSLVPALEALWQKHKDGVALGPVGGDVPSEVPAGYVEYDAERRKHQAKFRKLLFKNYPHKCFVCGFDQAKILEAAHIIPDAMGGRSSVKNGRLMCPNHHRAHDAGLFRLKDDKAVWLDASTEFLEPVKPRRLTAK